MAKETVFAGRPARNSLAHTFSIVARDPQTGEIGAAVQSHWFSVGSMVTWGEAGVGVVATQSFVDPSYGPLGLSLMRAGKSANEALNGLLASDSSPEVRQVAMIDARGRAAVHTGARCIAMAGHEAGEQFSVQANMMLNDRVWPAMAAAYRQTAGDLTGRLLAALQAGERAGGDVRGRQSAAILVVKPQSTGQSWSDRAVDLRVEDHPDPIAELARLIGVHRAYTWMNRGDEELSRGEVDSALESYRQAAEMAPHLDELPFWHAVTLADMGRVEESLPLFRQVFRSNRNWAVLLQRLPDAGLLRPDRMMIDRILAELNE
ncbi:MAG: DUF1028 domain-containing protein [Planctomycetota bacterium]|nr:DUF1028 domain-containing protein [Planctomycetota bacterium]